MTSPTHPQIDRDRALASRPVSTDSDSFRAPREHARGRLVSSHVPGLALGLSPRLQWLLSLVCVVLGLLAASLAPAAASADSLVFAKPDGNIYFANPDGSGQYQVTLDGSPSDPYFSPSETASGVIEAGHGTGSSGQIVQLTQNGTVLNQYTSAAPGGPLDPVVSPDGQLVAYYAFTAVDDCYPWICVGGATAQLVGAADHFVDPSTYIHEGTGFNHGTWLSNTRLLLFAHDGTLWLYDIGAPEPVQWGGLYGLMSGSSGSALYQWDDNTEPFLFEGAASADATRLAVVTGDGNIESAAYATVDIQLFSAAGDLATAADPTLPTPACTIAPSDGSGYQGNPSSQEYLFSNLTWSPDGQSLAFDYNGAIYVAHIPDVSNCSTITVSQVITSGSSPFWSAASIDPAPRPAPRAPVDSQTAPVDSQTAPAAVKRPTGPCSGLSGAGLQDCEAKDAYTTALAACAKRRGHAKKASCRRTATLRYHRALAKAKCQQITNRHKRAACVARVDRSRP